MQHARPPDFRALFESAPGLYLVLTPDLTIVAVSNAYLAATMTEREKILGRGIFDVFPDNPEEVEATGMRNLADSLRRVLEHRRPDAMAVQKYDIRRPEAEGGGFEERHWSPVNSPVLGPDGSVAYIIHRVEDVTEFLRLKQHRAQQDERAEELTSRAVVMEREIFQRAQQIQDANRSLRELHAELEARVEARTADLRRANEDLQRQIEERERAEEALRKSEEQLRQSQKLEAVGRLAGGIAHDFNNLLSVILSYCALLLEETSLAPGQRADIEEIQGAAERTADLTRQLLAFSRQQVLEPRIFDLNEILVSMERILGRALGEDIDLTLQPSPDIGRVRVDRSQIEQVIVNLAVNARDAMPTGGKLTIETANVVLDEDYAREHPGVEAGPHVMLAVTDTGIGMDAETQARAFEPFFTTKELGKGTGLGLSTVFGIVRQSGGNIWLYSEPGAGTTFKVYFPRTDGDATAVRARTSGSHVARGTETVLLVEDDEKLRKVAHGILVRFGYDVIEATGPAVALEVCERRTSVIHLLLTDLVMPGLSGRQLAERVRELRPDIRVLFMSGYTDDVVVRHGALGEGSAFLSKPITPEALARKVREVLDGG